MIEDIISSCEWLPDPLLLASGNVFSQLVYYSHLLPVILVLLVGIYVFGHKNKTVAHYIFLLLTVSFTAWSLSDLVLWASDSPELIMFFWSITILTEPVIYILCLCFSIVFTKKRNIGPREAVCMSVLFLPTLLLLPTNYSLVGFDLTNCDREAVEGFLVYLNYFIEIILIGWTTFVVLSSYKNNTGRKKEILLLTVGLLVFLVSFSLGNAIGSFTANWVVGQYGLFGMPIFLAILAYIIVKYKAFNMKVAGTQALVWALIVLIGSLLFIVRTPMGFVVSAITLVLVSISGIVLVKAVEREIKTREYAENLTRDLAHSNDKLYALNEKLKEIDRQKTEFVSIASHQLRSPLTAMKGYSSMLLEGSFGEISDKARKAVEVIFNSSQKLVMVIEDFLNITRIELGTMKYENTAFDLADITAKVVEEQKMVVKDRGLVITFSHDGGNHQVKGDMGKLSQVVSNLIDNAIKYTPHGSIKVSVTSEGASIKLEVKDTGVGIKSDVIPKLFQKFIRADDAGKTNISGTGLGLFVAKQIVEAHHGHIWAKSDGEGKGSTFGMDLPKV